MSRIGAWIVHDVAEHSRRLHDQLLRFLSLGTSVAHPAWFLEVDRLDERLVIPEAGPSGIVKALAIFCPDALLGKQSLVESHQVSNKIGIVLGAVSGVVQRNDVTHGQYLRSETLGLYPSFCARSRLVLPLRIRRVFSASMASTSASFSLSCFQLVWVVHDAPSGRARELPSSSLPQNSASRPSCGASICPGSAPTFL